MKKTLFFLLSLLVFTCCVSIKHKHEHHKKHTHYPLYSNIPAHKIIFPSTTPDRIIVNLTEDPAHSFAVNWRTSQQIDTAYVEIAEETHGPDFLSEGKVRRIIAKTKGLETENIDDDEPLVKAAFHSVIIKNLEPEKTYVYRLGDGRKNDEGWSEWFQIKTQNIDKNAPYSFIYFGDAQIKVKSEWSRVIRKSYQMIPEVDFMYHAGDLINHSESDKEWGEWFYAGSFIHATVPSIMTPGNHEYHNKKLSRLWTHQFTLPENGPLDELKEACYALDYQNMKLISIDARSFELHEYSKKAQTKWLDSVLASNTQKWVTLTIHYPILPTIEGRGNTELSEALKPIIDKYNVDLVLQGHNHSYARGHASNNALGKTVVNNVETIYAISVSGPKMAGSSNLDWMVKEGKHTQLFQIISVSNDTLKYNAYTTKGSLYDSFTLIKGKGGNKKLLNNKVEEIIEKNK